MRLSQRDLDALHHAILELYEFRDLQAFRAAVPQILLKLIPADAFVWGQCALDVVTQRATLLDCVASDPSCELVVRQLPGFRFMDHPFFQFVARTGDRTALKISDFLTLREFRDSAWYQECHRPCGVERQLAGTVEGPGLATLNFVNRRRDFTERDRAILNLLRPHFDQAQRNAAIFSSTATARARPLAEYHLTRREFEVASWLSQGKTNPEIGVILGLSTRTVEKHMERILQKFGVENRATAALAVVAGNNLLKARQRPDL